MGVMVGVNVRDGSGVSVMNGVAVDSGVRLMIGASVDVGGKSSLLLSPVHPARITKPIVSNRSVRMY
jgi:hypothetical protein